MISTTTLATTATATSASSAASIPGRAMERPPQSARPMRRAGSGRFPVKVSNGAADFPPDPGSPAGLARVQPASSRPHTRNPSQQNFSNSSSASSTARRPTIAILPLENGERGRSNSEGVVPATTRAKRMGMVNRKTSDLGTVPESRSSRFSHYRGLSHGSVMKENSSTASVGSSGDSSSSPVSPVERERARGGYVRRLSSLPEHKRKSQSPDSIIEGAKGLLYSLHLIQPHISSLIVVARDEGSKRSSLERVFYNASTHVDELDRELHRYNVYAEEDEEAMYRSSDGVRRTCLTCVMAYQHVGSLLLRDIDKIVMHGDPRYVRTLLLLIYGSLVEVRNACVNLCTNIQARPTPKQIPNGMKKTEVVPSPRDRSLTPTQDRPNPRTTRSRSGTVNNQASVRGRPPHSTPLYVNGLNGDSYASSISSTVVATPMTSESFTSLDNPYTSLSRASTVTGTDELEEERQFEKIFLKLTRASDIVLKAVPSVRHQFIRCIDLCKKQETQQELRALWNSLDQKFSYSMQMAELLKARLSVIKLKEPGVRNQREFWELCTTFVKAFVDAAFLVKDAKKLELIPTDVLQALRPVQTAVKEVSVLIESSPWKLLAAPQNNTPIQPQPITHAMIQAGLQQSNPYISPPLSGQGANPYITPLPATPLSAALGPAAQATVPSSATSTRNPMFSGNLFERAETLLSQPQPQRTFPTSITDSYTPIGSRSHSRHP